MEYPEVSKNLQGVGGQTPSQTKQTKKAGRAGRKCKVVEVYSEKLEEELMDKIREGKATQSITIYVEGGKVKGLERKEWWENTDFYVVPHKGRYYIVEAIKSGFQEWYDTTRVKYDETGYETINVYKVEGDVKEALKNIAWGTWNAYYEEVEKGEYSEIDPPSLEDLMKRIDRLFEEDEEDERDD